VSVAQVSYDCRTALFRMDMENADDIRLNTVLFKACLPDKRKFCPDVFPGNGRVEICLEEHMDKPDFTEECKYGPCKHRLPGPASRFVSRAPDR